MRILIKNIKQLVSPVNEDFAILSDFKRLSVYENVSIVVNNGIIEEIIEEPDPDIEVAGVINARNQVVMPAFVDPHTHLVFAGTREDEFNMRIQGKTYMEIAKAGGGINSTVKKTREASEEELFKTAKRNLLKMIEHGIGTFEIKSGYGLNMETELKQLNVIQRLKETMPVDIKATFLGAHEVPPEYRDNKQKYIDLLINEMLPAAKEQGIAEYCDIFCEEGVFDIEESREILTKAKELGFKIRMHADELTPLGGAELAAELGAKSADHLVYITDKGIDAMISKNVVFVMLPGTTFFLMSERYAPAKKIAERGGIVALSTDFNPGSSYTHSMPMIITLACLKMGLTIEQAINAATINAAYSLDLHNKTGSIHKGKQADFIFLDIPSYKFLVYNYGVNHITALIKKGKVVFQK
ncbi:imidazolonepropionase [Thermotomaculum hydrothermale]|uniref:Imidazolonepropionase n=1 Tax=Thermotomaculum hydrothermale TaxID=981385 RepID=A0A7R6PPD3_9BACT|nr:imidazolonepropionase [Thermotomaculum hydrothermale]BBB31916.1 imidazolonepropionase [Thermotomaculum hydrothermale]